MIKKVHEDAKLPEQKHEGDAGSDLTCVETIQLPPMTPVRVRTGIQGEIPLNHVGMVCPRSGLALKYGIMIVNAPGIIDAGYRGDWDVILLNTGRKHLSFDKGTRVAQLLIVKVESIMWVEGDELSESQRGEGGFGSTGEK